MASYMRRLGSSISVEDLRERLQNMEEKDREMMAGWGMNIKRKEGWQNCDCVAAQKSLASYGEDLTPRVSAELSEVYTEAPPGWCEVPGCSDQRTYFFITVGIVSILASTGRVGNVLVALRCVEVRDKALSFAFQTVFLSLFAMLPSPIIFGAIIDNTCLLWQEECGETTNCLLYDTDM